MILQKSFYTVKKKKVEPTWNEDNQLQQIFEFSQLLVLSLYNKKLRNFLKNKLKKLLKLVALNF